MKATYISVDGSYKEINPSNKKNFSLEELQSLVGGFIEIITLKCGLIMVVNEEGKLKELENNKTATFIASSLEGIGKSDYIAGNAVLCSSSMVK